MTKKEKRDDKFIKENQGKYFCKCGCGSKIIIKSDQRIYGIPKYIVGHYINGKNNPMKNCQVREKVREFQNRPEEKERAGKQSKDFWKNNPEEKEKIIKQIKDFWENHPEKKEEERRRALEQFKNGVPKETIKKMNDYWSSLSIRQLKSDFMKEFQNRPEVKEANRNFNIKYTSSLSVRKRLKLQRSKQIFPVKDTSIEVKIQNFLKQLGIEFFTHQCIKIKHGYQCDILIPVINLVIECDGDYWHKYPVGNDIDHVRTKELIKKGFKVLRLWEFEINAMAINEFEKRLRC